MSMLNTLTIGKNEESLYINEESESIHLLDRGKEYIRSGINTLFQHFPLEEISAISQKISAWFESSKETKTMQEELQMGIFEQKKMFQKLRAIYRYRLEIEFCEQEIKKTKTIMQAGDLRRFRNSEDLTTLKSTLDGLEEKRFTAEKKMTRILIDPLIRDFLLKNNISPYEEGTSKALEEKVKWVNNSIKETMRKAEIRKEEIKRMLKDPDFIALYLAHRELEALERQERKVNQKQVNGVLRFIIQNGNSPKISQFCKQVQLDPLNVEYQESGKDAFTSTIEELVPNAYQIYIRYKNLEKKKSILLK